MYCTIVSMLAFSILRRNVVKIESLSTYSIFVLTTRKGMSA